MNKYTNNTPIKIIDKESNDFPIEQIEQAIFIKEQIKKLYNKIMVLECDYEKLMGRESAVDFKHEDKLKEFGLLKNESETVKKLTITRPSDLNQFDKRITTIQKKLKDYYHLSKENFISVQDNQSQFDANVIKCFESLTTMQTIVNLERGEFEYKF
jgi:hypothetical protein